MRATTLPSMDNSLPTAGTSGEPKRRPHSFLFTWPNSRISVMGGEQAAGVLAQVKKDQLEARGESLSAEAEASLKAPILEKYETEGHPLHATARLWDDGVVDPRQTRSVLALALSATLNAPIGNWRAPVFRM